MKEKLLTFLLGQRLKDSDLGEEKYSVLWGIPVFASDAISSVSYAGEEILLVLIPFFGMMSFAKFLPIVAAIICLLGLLVFCYFQTIQAYPSGGGAYIVSHENLGELPGIIAGSSLTMDYILTVAVSSCAGAAAITSAFPGLFRYKALIAFFIITILTWGNLRGIRESAVLFGTPTYIFIFTIYDEYYLQSTTISKSNEIISVTLIPVAYANSNIALSLIPFKSTLFPLYKFVASLTVKSNLSFI